MVLDTDESDSGEVEFVGRDEIYADGELTALKVKIGAIPPEKERKKMHVVRYQKTEYGFGFEDHQLPGQGKIMSDGTYKILEDVRVLADEWVEDEHDCVVMDREPRLKAVAVPDENRGGE